MVAPLQATAVEIARASIQGRRLHLRALCVSLSSTRQKLEWVLHHLNNTDSQDWQSDQVADQLAGGTIRLEGALDGFVMLDLADSNDVSRQASTELQQLATYAAAPE